MTEKTDEFHQRLLRQSAEQNKPLSEKDLHKGYGGDKSTRRDLRAAVRTGWALIDKLEENTAALKMLSERIDELINLK